MPQARTAPAKTAALPSLDAGQVIVHPSFGVVTVVGVEVQVVAGTKLEMLVLSPLLHNSKVSMPLAKVRDAGLRPVSTPAGIDAALAVTGERPKGYKGVWSRRATDTQAKIATGTLAALAEVMRDMYRPEGDGEPSHSQRQLYEGARNRFAGEVMAAREVTMTEALQAIARAAYLPKGGPRAKPAEDADADDDAAEAA